MAPKTVIPWARALLHHGQRFKVVECWRLGGVYKFWFWTVFAPSTLRISSWYMFLEPNPTIHRSNIGVQLRKVTKLGTPTLPYWRETSRPYL